MNIYLVLILTLLLLPVMYYAVNTYSQYGVIPRGSKLLYAAAASLLAALLLGAIIG